MNYLGSYEHLLCNVEAALQATIQTCNKPHSDNGASSCSSRLFPHWSGAKLKYNSWRPVRVRS